MVYRKKVYRRKRYYKKKAQGGWGNMARKALNIATKVAALVNAEAKDYYVNQSSFATSYNGQLTSLNGGITAGTGDGQRTGDSIKMKTVTIRGTLTRNTADDVLRVILVRDKENTCTISNLLEYVGSSAVVNSPKDDDNYYKSKILLDRKYIITTDAPKKMFEMVYSVDEHTKFNNSTNAIEMNSLKLFTYSSLSVNGTLVEYVSKLSFMDN